MKKAFKATFIIFTLVILFSCAGTKTISVLTIDYLGKSLEAENLIVRSFFNEVVFKYGDAIPYKEKTELDFLNVFSESVKLHSTFDNVFVENIDTSSFDKKILELPNNKQVEISVPTTSLKIDKSGYILFIEDYNIYYMDNPTNNMTYKYHNMEFLVWDNNNGSIVSYGVLDFSCTKFNTTFSTLIKLIFENSPFQLVEENDS